MELKDWYEDNKKELKYGDLSQSYNRAMENLFVIGPCRDCKFWQKLEQCDCQDVPFEIYATADIPKTFGCIHFETKEDK